MDEDLDQLFARLAKGDSTALDGIIHNVLERLTPWVDQRMPSGGPMDYQDIVQKVCMELDRNIRHGKFEYDGPGRFWTYVRTIADHRIKDYVKSQKAAKHNPELLQGLVKEFDDNTASQILGRKEFEIVLLEAVDNLPERERVALKLHIEGSSRKDIADAMDTTESAVQGLLQRARAKVRKLLDDRSRGV
ncbi:MAG: sigma-70 family RNA polymerase sigma factor [Planctomycetales bacterium]|nr:sigma-70 family RNA polymerase sigma factor [Planctomycetales bacterium]